MNLRMSKMAIKGKEGKVPNMAQPQLSIYLKVFL
jgi:hypothetical protein